MAKSRRGGSSGREKNPNRKRFDEAVAAISTHAMLQPLADVVGFVWAENYHKMPTNAWAIVSGSTILANPKRKGSKEEWMYVLAHCLLHLGLEHHMKDDVEPLYWNVACDIAIYHFLYMMNVGKKPEDIYYYTTGKNSSELDLYNKLLGKPIPDEYAHAGVAGPYNQDMVLDKGEPRVQSMFVSVNTSWIQIFARGLRQAVTSALEVASGKETVLGKPSRAVTEAERARQWFISSYPLLGSLAASFQIIEEPDIIKREDIYVAAINDQLKEIYINPMTNLGKLELRFIIAHELLHAGLRHTIRSQGRDPYLWNIACDFVINGWLMEMGVGEPPTLGLLFDPELSGMSAEAVYDQMAKDMRRYRKLMTLRGVGIGDILQPSEAKFWNGAEGTNLDGFYRSALCHGLTYHESSGRGMLPRGLVESIRALDHPPIAWDVELARWFDNYFAPIEYRRSFARPSRRQSSTPDIPRPRWAPVDGAMDGRTFAVILDTSGSMHRHLLALALGAISSYAISREVPMARVIFCDAAAYDQGYMPVESISGRVKIKGRGGTALQPAIDLLERAQDFPKEGPILIITDGECDPLHIKREHAFLMPANGRLPFRAKGPIFRISK